MGWALCGGVVACAIAYPSTFLGWALCNGSVACTIAWLRTFGVGVVRQFDCLRYRLAAHVLGLGVCDDTVACAIAWPLTFWGWAYATIRLPALLLGRSRFVLSVVRRHGCPRHYLGRIRLRLGVVQRFGCPRYRLPAHA